MKSVLESLMVPPAVLTGLCVSPQHQQQVVQAMERAKQVTMGELNASIGVRGLPPLPHTVCTLSSHIFIFPSFLSPLWSEAKTRLFAQESGNGLK